jgi:hypothetical protein
MFSKCIPAATLLLIILCPSVSYAKTLIPTWYKCSFTHKDGKYYCATSCVNTKTGNLVTIYPAVCR